MSWADQHWARQHADGKDSDPLGTSQYTLALGDAFVSHMNLVGNAPGVAVKKLSEWLDKNRRSLNIDPHLLIQRHVHNCCLLDFDGGHVTWVEPGMAASPSSEAYKYQYQPKWRPGALGFVVFDQMDEDKEGWKTDLSTVKLIRPRRVAGVQNCAEVCHPHTPIHSRAPVACKMSKKRDIELVEPVLPVPSACIPSL